MHLIATLLLAAAPLGPCTATDGDTIRCGTERIRLLGIDAPELPGHCRRGRRCAPGDPHASRASLAAALTGPLTIQRTGTDRYGRTLALVSGTRGDLSCWQLRHRAASYVARWDEGGRVANRCSYGSARRISSNRAKAIKIELTEVESSILGGRRTFMLGNCLHKFERDGFLAPAIGDVRNAYCVSHSIFLKLPDGSDAVGAHSHCKAITKADA